MALPYDLYVRYLATTGLVDLVEVNQVLLGARLFSITQNELDEAWTLTHRSLAKGVVYQIENKCYGPDFMRNMNALEVGDMWLAHPQFCDRSMPDILKLVNDIHQDSGMRVTLQALLMKKVNLTEITRILSIKFSALLKEKHVDIYSRFFFNPCRMTRKDWKAYLGRCDGQEKRIYFTALTESVDILKTELELPTSISVSDSLQWLMTKSFLKARAFINIETPEAGKEAREWIDQVVKLTDKYEKYRSGDQNDFAKSLQMEFEFINDTFDPPDIEVASEIAEKNKVDG